MNVRATHDGCTHTERVIRRQATGPVRARVLCRPLPAWWRPSDGSRARSRLPPTLRAGWQPRARYRLCADPTLEELRKVCIGLRRSHGGREERLLLHFNGHGVPRPSNNGELWVFNRSFTQYIPVSAYELQSWLGSGSR